MPLYSKIYEGNGEAIDLSGEYKTPLSETISAAFEDAWESGPFRSSQRAMTREHFQDFGDMTDQEVVDYAREWGKGPVGMDLSAQEKLIAENGLQGKVKPDKVYDEETLRTIIEARKAHEERQWKLDKAPGWQAPLAFGAGMAGAMLDPLEVAACFVPVAGQQRKLAMLGQAKGMLGRLAARAKIGALEGLAGGMLSESMSASADRIAQQDHTAMQSLLNLAGGAVMGAALHPLAGAVGEIKTRKDFFKPWQMIEPDAESRALLAKHARAVSQARLAANPALKPEAANADALGTALLYDMFARNAAWRQKKSVRQIYEDYILDYKAGNITRRGAGDGAREDLGSLQGRVESLLSGTDSLIQRQDSLERRQAEVLARHLGQTPNPEILSRRLQNKIAPREAINFYEKQAAVIEFFQGSDASSGPAGLLQVIRRQMLDEASKPNASPQSRQLAQDMEKLCHVQDGAWTREAEELFAKKFMRQLADPQVGDARFRPAFEHVKSQLADICGEALELGLPASRKAQGFMNKLWQSSLAEADQLFRKALASILTEEPELRLARADIMESPPARALPASQAMPPKNQTGEPALSSRPALGDQDVQSRPAESAAPDQTPTPEAAQPNAQADATPEAASKGQSDAASRAPASAVNHFANLPAEPQSHNMQAMQRQLAEERSLARTRLEELRKAGLDEKTHKEMLEEMQAADAALDKSLQEADLLQQYAACVYGA